MTPTERIKQIKERCEKATQDGSFTLRVNTWLTAGDGRAFCAEAIDDIPWLIERVERLEEAMKEYIDHSISIFCQCDVEREGLACIACNYAEKAREALGDE